ncbi:MAG: hypothetical protein LBR26_00655 [Prevotella sp.]|nr:hypothetical protein [Prevotella sp.]
MEEEKKRILSLIIDKRMRIKAELNVYNLLKEKSCENRIDKLLDQLNDLDRLEKELRKKM